MGSRGSDGRPHRLDDVSELDQAWSRDWLLTVVALLALGAVTRHVSVAATGIASLLRTSASVPTSVASTAVATTTSSIASRTAFGTVAGDVTHFPAFVALLTTYSAARVSAAHAA